MQYEMGVMRCVGRSSRIDICPFVVFLSDIFRVYRYREVAWPPRYCSIASINRHVRHQEAPACKRVKARLPVGTAMYRSDDLLHRTGHSRGHSGVECDASCEYIHCQYNSEDEPNVSYILPTKLGIICNARLLFCRTLDVPAFSVPVFYHTKEFGLRRCGVVWYGNSKLVPRHIGPGLPSSYHIFR
jgi:hypothetical protein